MRNFNQNTPSSLTFELARDQSEIFKHSAIEHMGRQSARGAEIWNHVVERGYVKPDEMVIDPSTWVSQMKASTGYLKLGAQPMPEATKHAVTFHADQFPYPDEIAYRLLHETTHSLVYESQYLPATRQLMDVTASVRRATEGRQGLTALGSLDFYETRDRKVVEDTTELITMHAWDPEYITDYAAFLASPSADDIRTSAGLVMLRDVELLPYLTERAVNETLNNV